MGRGGGKEGGEGRWQCVPVGTILALESNSKQQLVAEYLGQII